MKILITGIAGFIGFHLATKFNQLGHDVVGLDNFNDYYDPELKHNRANILQKQSVECFKVDLKEQVRITDMVQRITPDLVVHLAAYAGVRYSMEHPNEYIDNNITGTQNLINACEEAGVKNVIYASTSCVMHGNPLPWKEDDKLGPQLSPYGYSKSTNEHQFNIAKIENVVGLRFFTVYGPYGRPDMALFDFTKNILAGNTIQIYNHGDMKRDFTYVDDIVQGIVLVSENMTERDIYCLGYGQQVNLMDFVSEIENNLDVKADKEFVGKHPADAKETWSDITKIKQLGYQPTTPIPVGVRNFVEWYKEYYE